MAYIVLCNYIRIAFLIRCALRFMKSCLLGMCSFIQGALCFIFSYFVFGHSDTILHPMCHRIYIFMSTSDVISTWNLVFNPMCPKYIFVFPIQITFLYPMYRMLYIATPTRYVLFPPMCPFQFDSFLHPMCHRLYIFILSRMCSFIVCFILSGPFVMLSPFRCVIYLMMSFPPECVPLSYVSYVLHCLLDCVPSLDMASAFYCQIHPGYVFFYPVWTMFYFVFFDSESFLPSDLSSPPVMCPFMLWFLGFIVSCAVGSRSPSGVSYVLYVMSIRDMLFYSM